MIERVAVVGVTGTMVGAVDGVEEAYGACTATDCEIMTKESDMTCKLQGDVCWCNVCEHGHCVAGDVPCR